MLLRKRKHIKKIAFINFQKNFNRTYLQVKTSWNYAFNFIKLSLFNFNALFNILSAKIIIFFFSLHFINAFKYKILLRYFKLSTISTLNLNKFCFTSKGFFFFVLFLLFCYLCLRQFRTALVFKIKSLSLRFTLKIISILWWDCWFLNFIGKWLWILRILIEGGITTYWIILTMKWRIIIFFNFINFFFLLLLSKKKKKITFNGF